jgi:phosphohistidine phosphatase
LKRLILTRHAKSDWANAAQGDHARPLNRRGRRSAAALGAWLREKGLIPDQILCSDAMRTRETFLRMDLPEGIATRFLRPLYHARQEDILEVLREVEGDCVLMLGHNPGICWCANTLVSAPPEHPQFSRYPTGATLVADFEIADWQETDWGMATARHFVVPREL